MGSVKDNYERQFEQGWFSIGEMYVCNDCFTDNDLSGFVEDHSTSTSCSYCGRTAENPIAAPMDDVMELIARSIMSEWTDPAEELPYESREGGYQGRTFDTYDLLWNLEFPTENEELFDDVVESLNLKLWCRRNYFSAPEDKYLVYSWQDFCQAIKHETRYLFFPEKDQHRPFEPVPSPEILNEIGKIIHQLELLLVFKQGSEFFRGRVHRPDLKLETAAELGPPPVDRARFSNRMSPAGIPMFYGCLDPHTVIAEILDKSRGRCSIVTIATFIAARDIYLIDLTNLPEVPSIFSDGMRHLRPGVAFLHEFVEDLSKPIEKDGMEHIEYVPTQVVTEYFRYRFRDQMGNSPDGIIYPSSRRYGGSSVVIFASNEQCIDEDSDANGNIESLLILKRHSLERILPDKSTSLFCALHTILQRILSIVHRIRGSFGEYSQSIE